MEKKNFIAWWRGNIFILSIEGDEQRRRGSGWDYRFFPFFFAEKRTRKPRAEKLFKRLFHRNEERTWLGRRKLSIIIQWHLSHWIGMELWQNIFLWWEGKFSIVILNAHPQHLLRHYLCLSTPKPHQQPAASGKRRKRETRPSGILKCSLDNKAQSAQKPRKERNFSPSFAEIICDGKKAANLFFICDIFILWILCRKLLIQRSPAIGSCWSNYFPSRSIIISVDISR